VRPRNLILAVSLAVLIPSAVLAHCQVPCGIYDDAMRIGMIEEHARTIEKAMVQIGELSMDGAKNYNQIVRWVMTKEEHAQAVQDIVAEYFLAQRIKPGAAGDDEALVAYHETLGELHHMLILAMKCKQDIDTDLPAKLLAATEAFCLSYFGEAHPYHH